MSDLSVTASKSRLADVHSGRDDYTPPRIARQRVIELVCGGTGRKDDWNFTFNPQEDPPPPAGDQNP